MSKRELDKGVIKNLNSGDEKKVIESLNFIRVNGDLIYLNEVFNAYINSWGGEVKNTLVKLLSDINDKEAGATIIGFLKQVIDNDDFNLFISSCWQSKVDYSKEIDFFIDVILHRDYQASIEAFTVVENSLGGLSDSEISNYIIDLKDAVSDVSPEKKNLIVELVQTFKKYIKPQ